MNGSYTVSRGLEELVSDISAQLYENFGDAVFPVVLVDQTGFSGQNSRYQADTYQIYSYMERGYITVNVHVFQYDLSTDVLNVKIAVFPPMKDTSSKARKIFEVLESLILERKSKGNEV